jgi:ubiquinone/menaquinone biosynthesis C-methylase UbiE
MIPSRRVFEEHAEDYDTWFDDHNNVYQAQMRVLRRAVPGFHRGLEVGVGSGRFAAPLGITCGIDPSQNLIRMAKQKGVKVALGEAEHLPYRAGSFDFVLMMTVICFLDDIPRAFQETHRVLEPGGILAAGFIEAGGEIFQKYQHESIKGRFLRFATFRTCEEVVFFFKDAGFENVSILQRVRGFCVMCGRKNCDGRKDVAD